MSGIYERDGQIHFGATVKRLDKIPVGNWIVRHNEYSGYYLEPTGKFTLPKKIYDDLDSWCDRILAVFNGEKTGNTNALFEGIKGSGKTLLAKMIAVRSKRPVLIVQEKYMGSEYSAWLSSISHTPCCLFMNEFDKVYEERKDQEKLLDILDGTNGTRLLSVLTSNNPVNEFYLNRPGRMEFYRKFKGLHPATIDEVIDDSLVDQSYKDELIDVTEVLGSCNMDVLEHIIKHCNQFKESPRQVLKYLNVQIEHECYDVLAFIGGKRYYSTVGYNPITSNVLYFSYQVESKDGTDRYYRYFSKDKSEFNMEKSGKEFTFTDREGNKLVFTPSSFEKEFEI